MTKPTLQKCSNSIFDIYKNFVINVTPKNTRVTSTSQKVRQSLNGNIIKARFNRTFKKCPLKKILPPMFYSKLLCDTRENKDVYFLFIEIAFSFANSLKTLYHSKIQYQEKEVWFHVKV